MTEYISKDGLTKVINYNTPNPQHPKYTEWSETFDLKDGQWELVMTMLAHTEIPCLWDQPMKKYRRQGVEFFVHSPPIPQSQQERLQTESPGILVLMPTHAATLENKTWNIYKSPNAAKTNRYSMVVGLTATLDEEYLEHADYNCNMVGPVYTVMEFIGYESESENWSPDSRDHNKDDAFSDSEISKIFHAIQHIKL